jgi:hypothetical protein
MLDEVVIERGGEVLFLAATCQEPSPIPKRRSFLLGSHELGI